MLVELLTKQGYDVVAHGHHEPVVAASYLDLDALVGTVVHSLDESLRSSGGVVVTGVLPIVQGDEAQLGQLFLNLIGNALKFHHPGRAPRVVIAARPDAAGWLLSISDNGIGIAPEFRERVFQLFRRLHTPEEFPGTGIGLSICRKVVERHGGRIWIEDGPGRGTSLVFTLPRDATRDRPADGAA